MSIEAMTWAFKLPLEPRAKITVLAIADNARDGDGVAWPSRALIAKKSGQSRATVNRRMRLLVELGVMKLKERFREDGTQTTDEIQLCLDLTPAELMRRMQSLKQAGGADHGADEAECDVDDSAGDDEGGGYQPDTLGVQSGDPRGALVTGGGLHSGHPHNEPSLEPESPPNPPPGGVRLARGGEEHTADGPLSKAGKQAAERRDELWGLFKGSYPGIAAMDQVAARTEFDGLPLSDAEWAVSVCAAYAAECRKLGKPPKNAHLWLKKAMFKNFAKVEIKPPPPEAVWIAEESDEDRALRFVRSLARVPPKFVRTEPDGRRGYFHPRAVGADLLAMLAFVDDLPSRWHLVEPGSKHHGAWQQRFDRWIGAGLPSKPGETGIRVPRLWPPDKDGNLYDDDAPAASSSASPSTSSASPEPQGETTS